MESYYHPHTVTESIASPYLNEDEVALLTSTYSSQISTTGDSRKPAPKLPTLYDEETHALLHSEPILDVLMQSRPLVWSFNGLQFDTPDRFLPKDASIYSNNLMANNDIYALNEYFRNTSININGPSSPVKEELNQDFDTPFFQLTNDDDISIDMKQPIMYKIEAPWWCSDSKIKHNNDKCVDNDINASPVSINSPLLPLPGMTLIDTTCSIGVQASPHMAEVEIQVAPIMIQTGTDSYPTTQLVEASTQCFTNTVPRIVIDAVTGTDEMERDLSIYSRQVSVSTEMDKEDESKLSPHDLQLLELECNLAAQIPLPLISDDSESLDNIVNGEDVLLSPDSDDFEFVEVVEAAE